MRLFICINLLVFGILSTVIMYVYYIALFMVLSKLVGLGFSALLHISHEQVFIIVGVTPPYLYFDQTETAYFLLYVDDIVFTTSFVFQSLVMLQLCFYLNRSMHLRFLSGLTWFSVILFGHPLTLNISQGLVDLCLIHLYRS